MSGFDPDWLALRAPADDAARSGRLIRLAAEYLAGCPRPVVCDLGAGTGASVAAFGPVFPAVTRWLLVDDDPACLARAAQRGPQVHTRQLDLATAPVLWPEDCTLVTATALFDLAAPAWLNALADRLCSAQLPLLSCLTYDGVMTFDTVHELDAPVLAAFNMHQQRDKGLGGPACGPDAPGILSAALDARGYEISVADTPWRLTPDVHGPLMSETLSGIARAAAETGTVTEAAASAWLVDRKRATQLMTVGHQDLFARPPGTA